MLGERRGVEAELPGTLGTEWAWSAGSGLPLVLLFPPGSCPHTEDTAAGPGMWPC